jgi:2-polyprenyl-6-methoxyphenol hydroxylase-like FAD-dependent oxidoreductase
VTAQAPTRAMIIGAGPGGLTAAIALARVGIEVAVFERAPELGAVGLGLGVQSNALRALRRLGIGDRVAEAGSELRVQEVHNGAGKLLFKVPQGEIADEIGSPTVGILRSNLQFALVHALQDDVLHLGHECVRVEQDAAGVTAHFANGRSERGALLIGADGGRSVVRKHVYGDQDPPMKYSGVTIWRAVLEDGHGLLPPGTSNYFNGPGGQFVLFPVGGEDVYWGFALPAPEGGKDPPTGVREVLCEHLSTFAEKTRRVVNLTPEENILRTDLYDRDSVKAWVKGRVVLLGDAAHLTTPFVGQGAGISIEDGVVLAKELALTDGLRDQRMLEVALGAYERQRVPRTAEVQAISRRLGKQYMMTNPVLTKLRDSFSSHAPASFTKRMVRKNIGFEV